MRYLGCSEKNSEVKEWGVGQGAEICCFLPKTDHPNRCFELQILSNLSWYPLNLKLWQHQQ